MALLLALVSTSSSQTRGTPSPLALKPTRIVRFTVDEGTWISLDVSPVDQTIVFDLLGDLYSLPIAGGHATRITGGMAFDGQPRFSPDGKTIAFTSDRAGVDDIWLMSLTNGTLHRLTHNDGSALYISPSWAPDGRTILCSKKVTGRTILVVVALADGAETTIPTSSGGGAADLGAIFSPDGTYVYASQKLALRDAGLDGYWNLIRIDPHSGAEHLETSRRLGGAGMRPQISRNGRYLVYGRPNGSYVGLMLRDLKSDEERWLVPEAQRPISVLVNSEQRDLLPGFAFTADSAAVVASFQGKIWQIQLRNGERHQIPFVASVEQRLGPPVTANLRLNDKTVPVRLVSSPAVSPDGKRVAFSAFDRIWMMDTSGGPPRRLTGNSVGEFHPSWSPDGEWIAYTTWDDKTGGGVYKSRGDGSGRTQCLTTDAAYYSGALFAPDGHHIAVIRGPRDLTYYGYAGVYRDFDTRNRTLPLEVWLISTDAATTTNLGSVDPGAAASEAYSHGSLQFTSDGSLFLFNYQKGLFEFPLNGSPPQLVLTLSGSRTAAGSTTSPRDIVLSPDGRHALARFSDRQIVLLTFDTAFASQTQHRLLEVSADVPPPGVHTTVLSTVGGDYLAWNSRGDAAVVALGASIFFFQVTRSPEVPFSRVDVPITLAADRPPQTDVTVLHGARLITMRGDEIIEKADVIVAGNRIAGVGRVGTLGFPPTAEVIDVTGKTIVPGFLDIHCHIGPPESDTHPTDLWRLQSALAYGVTTIRDPSTATPDLLTFADRITLGESVGPRVFTTLMPLYGVRPPATPADLRSAVLPYAEFYRTETVKNKLNRGRNVQQLLATVAREFGLIVDNEGYNDTQLQLTYLLDGFVALEHSYPTVPLFADILHLLVASGAYQTFTLNTEAGGDEYYMRQADSLHLFPSMMFAFYPPNELERLSERYEYQIDGTFFREFCRQPARLVAAGGHIGMGSHGDIPGIGYHFEMWAHALGGMRAHDVLRAATIWSAAAIGHSQDLGSIEKGKLADFDVLDGNPLQDVHNTIKLRWIMKNGQMYEAFSLRPVKRGVPSSAPDLGVTRRVQ